MCREMEQIYNEGERNGEERGRAQGMAAADISEIISISVQSVQKWLTGRTSLSQ